MSKDFDLLAGGRANVYALLSTLLSAPPTTEVVGGFYALAKHENLLSAQSAVAARTSLPELTPPVLEDLAREYEELFVIPGSRYLTPYESVFRDSRGVGGREVSGLTFGPSTDDVLRYYHVAGLEISPEYDELPDHLALELHFMRVLCQAESDSLIAGDRARVTQIRETEIGFLERHVTMWLPALLERAQLKKAHPFYLGVLGLAAEISAGDLISLKEQSLA